MAFSNALNHLLLKTLLLPSLVSLVVFESSAQEDTTTGVRPFALELRFGSLEENVAGSSWNEYTVEQLTNRMHNPDELPTGLAADQGQQVSTIRGGSPYVIKVGLAYTLRAKQRVGARFNHQLVTNVRFINSVNGRFGRLFTRIIQLDSSIASDMSVQYTEFVRRLGLEGGYRLRYNATPRAYLFVGVMATTDAKVGGKIEEAVHPWNIYSADQMLTNAFPLEEDNPLYTYLQNANDGQRQFRSRTMHTAGYLVSFGAGVSANGLGGAYIAFEQGALWQYSSNNAPIYNSAWHASLGLWFSI